MLLVVDQLVTRFADLAVEAQALVLIIGFISFLALLEQLLSLGLRTLVLVIFISSILTVGAGAIAAGYILITPSLVIKIGIWISTAIGICTDIRIVTFPYF